MSRWRHARERPDAFGFVAPGDYIANDPWQLRRVVWVNGSSLRGQGIYGVVADDMGRIKIGRTGDIRARLASIESLCPIRVRLFAWIRGPFSLEPKLHEKLRDHRVHLEWFEMCQEVTAALVAAAHHFGGGYVDERQDFTGLERDRGAARPERADGEAICDTADGSVACLQAPWGDRCE